MSHPHSSRPGTRGELVSAVPGHHRIKIDSEMLVGTEIVHDPSVFKNYRCIEAARTAPESVLAHKRDGFPSAWISIRVVLDCERNSRSCVGYQDVSKPTQVKERYRPPGAVAYYCHHTLADACLT